MQSRRLQQRFPSTAVCSTISTGSSSTVTAHFLDGIKSKIFKQTVLLRAADLYAIDSALRQERRQCLWHSELDAEGHSYSVRAISRYIHPTTTAVTYVFVGIGVLSGVRRTVIGYRGGVECVRPGVPQSGAAEGLCIQQLQHAHLHSAVHSSIVQYSM